MMDDRTMLELAARAAGMHVLPEGKPWPDDNVGWFFNQVGSNPPALYNRATRTQGMWAPLNDDGDALRLAVKLRLEVYIHETDTRAVDGNLISSASEHHGDNPYAATRRAIVRAAAEIGKAKGES